MDFFRKGKNNRVDCMLAEEFQLKGLQVEALYPQTAVLRFGLLEVSPQSCLLLSHLGL